MPTNKYPWEKWFSRKTRLTLEKGKDYECATHVMVRQIRNAASKRSLKVSIHQSEYSLTVDFNQERIEKFRNPEAS